MITRQELADLLLSVRVSEVAKEANVAQKTVYRLRNKANVPGIETARKLVDAVAAIKAGAKVSKTRKAT